ncbi:MAG TPA: alpha-amylase family glycosyl hydrolase [Ohtaekwangia sp.]
MKKNPRKYPSLYQINTRVWLTDLSKVLGRKATLDDIPDAELDRFVSLGFHWVWLLSVWTTGEQGQRISRENKEWRHEFELTLPDLKEEDIGGSGFAIADYHVHPELGGDEALKRLREKLNSRGLKLMLDFVPNHLGPDHAWVHDHPEYFVQGTETDLKNSPLNYTRIKCVTGEKIFAYGRDPYFSGWPDTAQIDYSNPDAAQAMKQELVRIASQCDGVRCDMAMLILPDVFEKTWGRKMNPFWPDVIKTVRKHVPDFCFMAEVYWDMEWTLQQQGFDYAYDKRLYDRLREGFAKAVREHFYAGLDYQDKLVRFLENHDELRAASAFDTAKHKAAAVITFLSPGLRFFHQGQLEGKIKRISPHLIRGPVESTNEELSLFYTRLLTVLQQPVFHARWQWLECNAAWDGNESWNSFIAFSWEDKEGKRAVVVVNYAPHNSQCYVRLPFANSSNTSLEFKDRMSEACYIREGNDLLSRGMYFDLPPWGYHIFEVI